MDVAGTVVAVGRDVNRLKVGDEVWAFNAGAAVYDGKTLGGLAGHAWAPYVVLRETGVGIKPKSISFTEAGTLPLVAQTSLQALKLCGAPWDRQSSVLILGATGGAGHVAVQLAKALGATHVIATASASHTDFVHKLGADRFIDYHTEDWWDDSVIPDGSLDAIYDTVLQPVTGDRAFAKLKDHGRYVSLCNGIPSCVAPMPSVINRLKRPSLSATGLRCTPGSCASVKHLDELSELIDAGKLRGHVNATMPLTSIQRAIDLLASGSVVGKVAVWSACQISQRPDCIGLGEKPTTVKTFLETLVGVGGGAGMWVIEEDNPHTVEDRSFNAGYFVVLGSEGALPIGAEEMYWPLFQALQKVGHPFAPRVGYLDVEEDQVKVNCENLALLDAIAEGAVRGAMAGLDGADEETASNFAVQILDQVLGPGAGRNWRLSAVAGNKRPCCAQCGEGFDSEAWHRSICPAMGPSGPLAAGDPVQLAGLQAAELNGKEGILQSFDRGKQRWVVRMGERDALFKASNLERRAA
ncbi:unnamed protein product [Polarella glacialis]|uniref:Enoyl reductase (ER) domain-containing protein n=1 Tax=Polarella glacialis TaxID=89957 RepID=A0A813M4T9_POLGL|nr:unnamed protein product [Polarella glacialis]